jgi:hypothetical protein
MGFTTGAWIGIAAGVALAAFDYFLVLYAVQRGQQQGTSTLDDRKLSNLKTILALAFVIFPVLGYVVGNILVEQGLLPR